MSLNEKLAQAERAADRLTASQQRQLLKSYSETLKEIRSELAKGFQNYGDDYVEWQKYNRLQNLEKNINKEVGKLSGKSATRIKSGIGDQIETQYYYTGYALETSTRAKLGFGLLDKNVIEAAVENPLDNVGFLQRNRDNHQRLARQMREELTQGLIRGEGFRDTADRIKNRMDVGATNTMRIVQTENHRAQTQGRLKGYEQAESYGVELKRVWTSTLDDRTRDTHQNMDGQVADEDGMFDVNGVRAEGPGLTGVAEEDINCRCTVRVEVEDESPRVRRSREASGSEIGEYRSYKQWKAARINE